MTYIKKESLYELCADFESVYPEAAAAFRLAVTDLPEGLVRCKECKHADCAGFAGGVCLCGYWDNMCEINGFCSCGEPKEGAE